MPALAHIDHIENLPHCGTAQTVGKGGKTMNNLIARIETHLNQIRNLTSSDFAGLAWTDRNDYIIRWKFASGNRNERYKRIILRPGRGIAGQVIRSGRPMRLDSFTIQSGDDAREYPIFLAENLKSAAAAPVVINSKVKGVLLIGTRMPRSYTDEETELVVNIAEQLGSMIQSREDQLEDVFRPGQLYREAGGSSSVDLRVLPKQDREIP
jgi:nitrogen regulatory protein A